MDYIWPPFDKAEDPRKYIKRVDWQAAPAEYPATRISRLNASQRGFPAEFVRHRPAQRKVYALRARKLRKIERIIDGTDAQVRAVHLNQDP